MGCATKCVAFSFFFFNLIYAILGVAIIILGVLLHLEVINYLKPANIAHEPSGFLPIVIIVLGGTIIIVSLFGCFGVGKGGVKLLTTYIIILVILFALKLCLGFYIMFTTNCEVGLQNNIESEFKLMINEYSNNTAIQHKVDEIQQKLHCCGVTNSLDWTSIPASCCEDNKQCHAGSQELFARGCSRLILDNFLNVTQIIYILCFAFSVFNILGVIFAGLLITSIKNDHRRSNDY
ncbi:Tetraspanin family [Popillia japonica]|uniref:Tetraspanin n=1 Tax=Popillia japonica TaxID=7064 RepID=A0AAW1IV47_POPJA